MLAGGLAHEERGLDVDVHHVVPVFFAELHCIGAANQAGVVDQDVEAAKAGDGFGDDALHRLDADQVGVDVDEAAAQRAHFFGGFIRRDDAGTGNVRAGGGQRHGDALAQTGIGTGYQSDLAFETEWVRHGVPLRERWFGLGASGAACGGRFTLGGVRPAAVGKHHSRFGHRCHFAMQDEQFLYETII